MSTTPTVIAPVATSAEPGTGAADERARAAVRELVAAATAGAQRGDAEPKAPELPLRAQHGFD